MVIKATGKIGFSVQMWDLAHYKRIEDYVSAIDRLHNQAIAAFARMVTKAKIDPEKPFSFTDYPSLKNAAVKIVTDLGVKMQTVIESGSSEQWLFACKKNDAFLQSLFDTSKIDKPILEAYQDRNLDALSAFQSRKIAGMDLSGRIWKQTDQFKKSMELGIDVGLGEGRSAQQLSRDLRQNLLDPDRLFRRVRDKRGQLQLSKAAQAFHPGQGVYRSSYKNAMRLTRSEINMAYRESERLRYDNLDFVLGFEVRLSNNHTLNGKPFVDICDVLAGRYPKTFIFTGWHPQCRCFVTPILQDYEEFRSDRRDRFKAALNGTEYNKYVSKNLVTDVPQAFKDWAAENQAKIDGYKSTPYFVKYNFKNGKVAEGLALDRTALKAKGTPAIVAPVEKVVPVKAVSSFEKYSSGIDAATNMKGVKDLMSAQLKANLGYDTRIIMSEADTSLAVAKAYAKEFVVLTDTYELEMPCIKFYTTQSKAHYGQVSVLNSAGKAPKLFSDIAGKAMNVGQKVDYARILEVATEKSLCDAERLQLSTINHEFAHNIFITSINRSSRASDFAKELRNLMFDYSKELFSLKRGSAEYNKLFLGKYASKNADEFLAESFQEYRNRKSPSKYAKLVGDLVDKYYKK